MRLNCGFEILNLDDENIAVPIGENAAGFSGVLKLNEEAAVIMRLLADDTSEEQIAEELLKEYSATKEQVLDEVHKFIEQLRNKGFIVD